MKYYNYLSLVTLFLVMGCNSENVDEEHHYDNKLYITSATITDDLLIKADVKEATRSLSYRLASPANQDISITFDAAPALTASYNMNYDDHAEVLPVNYYEIPNKTVTIEKGAVNSNDVVINFKGTHELNREKRFVLPVTIVNADIPVLESKKTVYFVFKGAALINVVANIDENYFPVYWKDYSKVNSLRVITVEALVRSSDWTDGRDNALSTIFGVEGEFLVRIGDGDRPRDQYQCVAPGGNFPGANVVDGLPVDEFVHIATVYNADTGERSYYKNGEKVYSDSSATRAIDLSSSCYIGYSWEPGRWLPGEISEVRVWNVARTAEEIASNPYMVDPHSEGLIAYWKFNEGTGSKIIDHTGNGNDLTGNTTPTWINVELPELKK